jgi:DNA primase
MSSIDEIKARIDIVDLVSETVQLRRSGKSYSGFCPFHPNTRTPAFVVFPDTGTWRCFGQCNEGGDIFHFVMKKEGWDFSEALHYLADKAGVQLKPPTPAEQALVEEHDSLRALLEDAVTFFRHNLTNTPAGQQALTYLHQRGLSDATIETFGLGYAPNAWEAALTHFKSRGHSERSLLEAGLASERPADETGQGGRRVYDRFRHRIMFPIRDERGRMAGFGARIINPEDLPKFLNSPQTPVFDKSRLLYGLDRARRAIRAADQAVIVEGYLDVIALHQAGFENAVSPMGTALTEHQLRLLKRLTRQIVLALDPDAAGDQATLRGLQVARQALDHSAEAFFDARGLLAHETRLQADIRVTTLPPGNDPDEVVQRDPAEWQRIVADAKPVVVHVMETLAAGRNVDDAKVKSEIAAQVLPLIKDVPNDIEREAYRQRLARLLRVDERALQDGGGQARPGRPARRSAPGTMPGGAVAAPKMAPLPVRTRLEAHCLGVLMRRPELVFRIDRELQKDNLPRLSRKDFDRADYQTIFDLVQESLAQDISEPASYVLNGLSLPLMEMADELLKLTETLDPVEDRVLEDILRGLLDLRRREVNQNINHLKFIMGEYQEQGDMRNDEYQQSMRVYLQVLNRIDKALGRFTSRLASSSIR